MVIASRAKAALMLLEAVAVLCLPSAGAWAQGCIVGRQCTPGEVTNNYLLPNQYDVALNYRGFTANEHYNGTTLQTVRHQLNNFVINRQNIFDLVATRGITRQLSVDVDVPYVHSGWSITLPVGAVGGPPPGPRYQQNAAGIGDISVNAQYWLLDTEKHMEGNIALGLGIKFPTGNDHTTSNFPNLSGTNIMQRTNDQSIQPGDGSFGIPTSFQAFKLVGSVNFFADGSYLISPADTNNVPSIVTTLGLKPSALAPSTNVNSVPDQYLLRIGAGVGIPWVPGLSASVDWRKEGVPAQDLLGDSHGFRRPGFSTSIEPGLSYTRAATTVSVSVPLTITRDRVQTVSDGVGVSGDATFANSQLIINISHRFNAR